MEGFDEDAIMLEKRGHQLALRAVEVSSAAAHNQWRPYVRLEKRKRGDDCSLGPPYQEFYDDVRDYRVRRQASQDEVAAGVKSGMLKGGKRGSVGKERSHPGRRRSRRSQR